VGGKGNRDRPRADLLTVTPNQACAGVTKMTCLKTLNIFVIAVVLSFGAPVTFAGQFSAKPVISTTGTLKKLYPARHRVPTLPGAIGEDPNKDPYDKSPCKYPVFVSHEVPDNDPASVVFVGSWQCGKQK